MAPHWPVIFHYCMLGYTLREVNLADVGVDVSAPVSFSAFCRLQRVLACLLRAFCYRCQLPLKTSYITLFWYWCFDLSSIKALTGWVGRLKASLCARQQQPPPNLSQLHKTKSVCFQGCQTDCNSWTMFIIIIIIAIIILTIQVLFRNTVQSVDT